MNGEGSDDPIGQVHDFLLQAKPGARATLASIRDARAPGPGPEPESLRAAYLGLLKLSLCDLAGASTVSVGTTPGGAIASRVLRDEQLRIRAAGLDWPFQGLTMTGLRVLDDLQWCVESVVADDVPGDLIEAGSWRGGASILMRATLASLGEEERTVWVADSFQGFPRDAGEHVELSAYEFFAAPLDEVKANFARLGLEEGVRFVPGFFEQTLPPLRGRRWAIVRLDGDTYEATRTSLEALYPGLARGGHLIVDDYGVFDECRRAVDEFRATHDITEPIEEVDWSCVRWRRETDAPVEAETQDAAGVTDADETPLAPPSTRRYGHVPTLRELELERELAELRAGRGAEEGATRGLFRWIRR